jgi:hypothetical protein
VLHTRTVFSSFSPTQCLPIGFTHTIVSLARARVRCHHRRRPRPEPPSPPPPSTSSVPSAPPPPIRPPACLCPPPLHCTIVWREECAESQEPISAAAPSSRSRDPPPPLRYTLFISWSIDHTPSPPMCWTSTTPCTRPFMSCSRWGIFHVARHEFSSWLIPAWEAYGAVWWHKPCVCTPIVSLNIALIWMA